MALRDELDLVMHVLAIKHKGELQRESEALVLSIPEGEGMTIIAYFYNGDDESPICTTNYKAKGKEFTFDRIGVEDSFYFDSVKGLAKQVTEQIARVKKAQERLALTNEFNLGPRTIMASPTQLQEIVEKIKSGKGYTHTSSGFGRGYVFGLNPVIRNRFDRAVVSKELVELVGKPVYVTEFDCD